MLGLVGKLFHRHEWSVVAQAQGNGRFGCDRRQSGMLFLERCACGAEQGYFTNGVDRRVVDVAILKAQLEQANPETSATVS